MTNPLTTVYAGAVDAARTACAIRCQRCGAAVPIELLPNPAESPAPAKCRYCQHVQPLPAAALERLRTHVQLIGELTAQAGVAQGHAQHYRAWQDPGRLFLWGSLLFFSLATVLFGADIARALVHAGMSADLVKQLLIPLVLLAPLGYALFYYVILFVKPQALPGQLPRQRIDDTQCSECGATVPTVLQLELRCPFCEAKLVHTAHVINSTRRAGEQVVNEEWHTARREEQAARQGRDGGASPMALGIAVPLLLLMLVVVLWAWLTRDDANKARLHELEENGRMLRMIMKESRLERRPPEEPLPAAEPAPPPHPAAVNLQ